MAHSYSVHIDRLTHTYRQCCAVDSIDMEIRGGEVSVLLGRNGAGKTTLIRLLCRLLRVQRGDIRYHHDGVSLRGEREIVATIGYSPQRPTVWPDLTCYEHLQILCSLYGVERNYVIPRLLDLFDLTEKKRTLAAELSGGMLQKLNCAMALVHDPPFLVFDESESGLDIDSRLRFRELLRDLATTEGKAILYATHDIAEAQNVADRIGILHGGQLLLNETMDELRKSLGKHATATFVMPDGYRMTDRERDALSRSTDTFSVDQTTVTATIDSDRNTIARVMGLFQVEPLTVSILPRSLEDLLIEVTTRGGGI
jgi:ABC-2 type transport system ATP-binding protein